MFKSVNYYTLFVVLLLLFSCDIKKSDILPEAAFTRVYESQNINEEYFPQDIIQIANNNYLVLSALKDSSLTNFPLVCVIALDETGEVISREILPMNYSNPVPGWIVLDDNYYFACMDDLTLQTKLINVRINGESISWTALSDAEFDMNRKMPLYAWSDGEDILFLNYDYSNTSYINIYDQNLNAQHEIGLSTVGDFTSDIWNHMQIEGKQKPFFIDAVHMDDGSKDYIINCLENYTLALLRLNKASGQVYNGRVYSYQEETGISAALHLGADSFALARYHSGNTYISPSTELNWDDLILTKNLDDVLISQYNADTPMDIIAYNHDDTNYIVYASTTTKNQILLLFFNAETGEQEFLHTLGFGNPVEVKIVKEASDGGLIVLGQTRINGEYERIILYKLDKEQLNAEN